MFYVPSGGSDGWRRLLLSPDRHWRDGYSAKMLAERWEGARGCPPEVAALFPEAPELLLGLPEHKVGLPGRGHPSQNDLFALLSVPGGLVACTVEGKVEETFGPTVGEWLVDASPGKRERLAALCDLLALEKSRLPATLRYQLLHRAASALIEAARFRAGSAAMIVHSFSATDSGLDDFRAFAGLFGAAIGPGEAVAVPVKGTTLRLGWARGPAAGREA